MPFPSLIRAGLVGLSLLTGALIAPQAVSASGVTLSTTAGPARTRISVSAPSCVGDATTERTVDARLLVGPVAFQKLAGAATNGGSGAATLIVPDWADPNRPAAVEATCTSVDRHTGASTTAAFAPMPFDVLPSTTATQLDASFSRTTFEVGQSSAIFGSGCTEAGTFGAFTGAQAGSDVTGRSYRDPVWGPWGGFHAVDPLGRIAGSVTAESSAVVVEVLDGQDPPHAQIEVSEVVSPVRAGSHVAFTACQHGDQTQLFTKPKALTLLPNPAVERSDMVVVPSAPSLPHRVRLSGRGCTQGSVSIDADGASLADIRASLRTGAGAGAGQVAGARRSDRTPIEVRRSGERGPSTDRGGLRRGGSGTTSALASPLSSATVTPDGSGDWSYDITVPFTDGFVGGQAVCGNPLGSGFRYHAQAVRLGAGTGAGTSSASPA